MERAAKQWNIQYMLPSTHITACYSVPPQPTVHHPSPPLPLQRFGSILPRAHIVLCSMDGRMDDGCLPCGGWDGMHLSCVRVKLASRIPTPFSKNGEAGSAISDLPMNHGIICSWCPQAPAFGMRGGSLEPRFGDWDPGRRASRPSPLGQAGSQMAHRIEPATNVVH